MLATAPPRPETLNTSSHPILFVYTCELTYESSISRAPRSHHGIQSFSKSAPRGPCPRPRFTRYLTCSYAPSARQLQDHSPPSGPSSLDITTTTRNKHKRIERKEKEEQCCQEGQGVESASVARRRAGRVAAGHERCMAFQCTHGTEAGAHAGVNTAAAATTTAD